MNDHPVDAFLAARFPAAEHLREPLRRRTLGVLWRRRWLKRLALAAALAACYAAGLWTRSPGRPLPPADPQTPPRPVLAEAVKPPPAPAAAAGAAKGARLPALVLEWQAFDSPDRRAELFRQ